MKQLDNKITGLPIDIFVDDNQTYKSINDGTKYLLWFQYDRDMIGVEIDYYEEIPEAIRKYIYEYSHVLIELADKCISFEDTCNILKENRYPFLDPKAAPAPLTTETIEKYCKMYPTGKSVYQAFEQKFGNIKVSKHSSLNS